MKAKLKDGGLMIIAETQAEEEWVLLAAKKRILSNHSASVGASPNWISLRTSDGVDYFDMRDALKKMRSESDQLIEMFDLLSND